MNDNKPKPKVTGWRVRDAVQLGPEMKQSCVAGDNYQMELSTNGVITRYRVDKAWAAVFIPNGNLTAVFLSE